ncbi:Solute carrier family 2, facilitated glucose transporter member 8 [Camponotus floridanus]|uniref:Solute carrier family 2, facilitated glucose transporter member 8 n=1 Tax=Camponotus floridanus TaxID=104421 RepID=E2ADD7_CAMFO|nr:facilitated trehalose transporter Tret1-2 homolog [Camponotus floridanus]EFN68553.1 Solute carrier family 2, facilitated glucose transporter member 8 [Camponotus floridanus]
MVSVIDINNTNEHIDINNRRTDIDNSIELTNVNNIMNEQMDIDNKHISTCVDIRRTSRIAEEEKWERNGVIYQILMGLCANVVVLTPGMGVGYYGVAQPAMTAPKTDDLQLDANQANWAATTFALTIPLGCLLTSPVMERGRKLSMVMASLISVAGWVTIYLAKSYEVLLVGSSISGISTGMAAAPATIYAAEIAEPKWRGTMVTWTSLYFSIGGLLVYIFGYIFKNDWRLVALMCAIFPVVSIALTLLVMPESPLWLRDQNRPEEALKIMKKFRGIPKDQPAPAEVLFELKPQSQEKDRNLLKHLMKRSSLVPFVIMNSYFLFQQFSGTFLVTYNVVTIMEKSGIQIDPYIGAILIGVARLIASFLATEVCRRLGVRIPSIISGIGMTIFIGGLSLYLFLAEKGTVISDKGIIPTTCMMLFIFTNTLGYLTIPFAMVGEIYPSKVKDILSNVTVSICYLVSAITVKIYPDMERLMHMYGVYFFFGIVSLIGLIFIIFFLPETKGKTLSEIEDMFSKKKVSELSAEKVVGEIPSIPNRVDSLEN